MTALGRVVAVSAALAALVAPHSAAGAEPAEPPRPRADEQLPRPYVAAPFQPIRRRVLLGADLGMVQRPVSSDAQFAYSPGLVYTAHARLELLDWFGHAVLEFLDLRAIAALNSHGVEARAGAALDAPAVTVIQLGARAEPTWTVTENVRLWLGLGVAWERLHMDSFELPNRVHVPRRAGVAVEYSAAVGSIIDLIPNWLALELSVVTAWAEHQSGSLFDSVQVFDAEGRRRSLAGMPLFERAHYGFAGLSLVL